MSLLPGSLLSQLLKLKQIILSSRMRFEHLQHLSCLTALQSCRVTLAAHALEEPFSNLNLLQDLTRLHLASTDSQHNITNLSLPTNLHKIQLFRCTGFRPAVLWQMGRLRSLSILETHLMHGGEGTTDLLALLRRLPALPSLDLASGTIKHQDTGHPLPCGDQVSSSQYTHIDSTHPPFQWFYAVRVFEEGVAGALRRAPWQGWCAYTPSGGDGVLQAQVLAHSPASASNLPQGPMTATFVIARHAAERNLLSRHCVGRRVRYPQ